MTTTHSGKPGEWSIKKEFAIFLSIPLATIIMVAVFVQGPSLFAKPKYDFVYSSCQSYDCGGMYVIGSGDHIALQSDNSLYAGNPQPALYYYDEARNATKRISQAEAINYRLDASNVSPDGYTLWQDNASSDSPFWSSSGDGNWYLKNGGKKKHLNLTTDTNYGSDVQFLGWVQQ